MVKRSDLIKALESNDTENYLKLQRENKTFEKNIQSNTGNKTLFQLKLDLGLLEEKSNYCGLQQNVEPVEENTNMAGEGSNFCGIDCNIF